MPNGHPSTLILGLDPGSRYTGFGLIRKRGNQLSTLDFGRFSAVAKLPLVQRLASLTRDLDSLLDSCQPEIVAIESTFLGMNPRSLVVLSQARGALLSVVGRRGIEVFEYAPSEIKNAVAGNGRADKEQVSRMVRILLTLGEQRLAEDASDALAAAICCAHRHRLDKLQRGPTA